MATFFFLICFLQKTASKQKNNTYCILRGFLFLSDVNKLAVSIEDLCLIHKS